MNFYSAVVVTALATALDTSLTAGATAIKPNRLTNVVNSIDSACNCPVEFPGLTLPNCGKPQSNTSQFMTVFDSFLKTQCDIEDPCGQITPPTSLYSEYDFVVVGGGSAGSVVASRLSEVADCRVLLIEAGVNEPTSSQVPSYYNDFLYTSIDWQYWTEPEQEACLGDPQHRCYWPRGKVIGGTSVLNGMMYTRGNKKDYDNWEALGNTGWAYDYILPYFLKSEDNLQISELDQKYHSAGGLLPVSRFSYQPPMVNDLLAAATELGYRIGDLTGEHQEGFGLAQMNSKNGTRYSMARAFLRPAKNRTNLHILLNTTATRVLIHIVNGSNQAYGVEVLTSAGTLMNITARKEVVVSGGAVNSPQILLLSGIGNKTELESVNVSVVRDLPGVGRNLHNHVSYTLYFHVHSPATEDLNWASAMEYMLSRGGPLSGTAITQVTGFVQSKFTNATEDDPDIQMFFTGYQADCASTGVIGEPSASTGNETALRVVNIAPTLVNTKSRGYLTLRDNNPLSHPRVYGKYLTDREDVDVLIDGIKIAINFTKAEALDKYNFQMLQTPIAGCENVTFETDEYWECAIRTNTNAENHQAGSCKMGASSDPLAVVDERLRVHGVGGLRVVDASIMPKATSGNINAPVVMIAEKAADMIKQDWSLSSGATATLKDNSVILYLLSLSILTHFN